MSTPKPLIKEAVTEENLETEALPTTENDIFYPPNYIPKISELQEGDMIDGRYKVLHTSVKRHQQHQQLQINQPHPQP